MPDKPRMQSKTGSVPRLASLPSDPPTVSVLVEHLWDDAGELRLSGIELASAFVDEEFRQDFVADMVEMVRQLESTGADRKEIARRLLFEAKADASSVGRAARIEIDLEDSAPLPTLLPALGIPRAKTSGAEGGPRPRGHAGRLRRISREQNAQDFKSERSLMAAWKEFKRTEDEQICNRLIEHYLRLVRYIAERLAAKLPDEVDVEDLMSAGIFGLVDAIDAFDLERGVKFETYCAPRVRGAILDELGSMDRVPRYVRRRVLKVNDAIRALEVELGRLPTEDELARRLGMSAEQFQKLLRDATTVSLVSLSQKFNDSDSSRDVFEIDVLPDERPCDPVIEAQKQDSRDLVTKGLSRAERLIIVLYYYEQMTMKEIGATLDLSESRVSQMHSSIIERLRAHLAAKKRAHLQTAG